MKQFIFLIISSLLYSCASTKITTTLTEQDSTRVEVKIDTIFIVQQDTIKFDSLLSTHLLLEGRIDSIESLPESEIKIIQDERSRALYIAYKQKYNSLLGLRQGARIDMDFPLEKDIFITNKDTSYTETIRFLISVKGDSIGLEFNQNLNILSTQTTHITEKHRKITLIAWLGSKYTLYLLSLILIILIVIFGKKLIKIYL